MRAAVVIVALTLAPAFALPQSLGDAARKQAHERSKRTLPPSVYTEADLHGKADRPASAPADLPATSTRADAHAKTASPAAKETSEDSVRDQLDREAEARKEREREWRRLARAALARLAEAQHGYDPVCGSSAVVLPGS
jgi:hypothetical protein